MSSAPPNVLFTRDDTGLVTPTAYASGPWDPAALHGGPVAALLARAIETTAADAPMDVARLTVELLRPVPLLALRVRTEIARPGRKVQLLEASLEDSTTGAEVARARALRIRTADIALPYDDPHLGEHLEPEAPPPGPAGVARQRSTHDADRVAFHNAGSEHRFVAGTWADPGPVTVWVRLLVPLFQDEEPSGLQRAVAAADFANGVARVLPFETHLFINPDLTIHLLRPPQGQWIGMASRTHLGDEGYGLAESALYDERGRFGRSVQSLIVDTR